MARGKHASSKFKRKHVSQREFFPKKKKDNRKNFRKFLQMQDLNQTEKNVETEQVNHVGEDVLQPLDLLLSTFPALDNGTTGGNRSYTELSDNEDELCSNADVSEHNGNDIEFHEAETFEICESFCENENQIISKNTDVESNLDSDFNDVLDPFALHFFYDLSTPLLEAVTSAKYISSSLCWPKLNNLKIEIPKIENENSNLYESCNIDSQKEFAKCSDEPKIIEELNWNKLHVKLQIQNNIKKANKDQLAENSCQELTPLQKEVFSIINNYQDLFYPERNVANGEEIRFVYCLHVVNHILKTRSKILHHNEKMAKITDGQVPDAYRDQGLVRPKVIIIVPFKESCLRIVKMISSILIHEDKGNVINKVRFLEEFSGSELIIPKKNAKPEDYEQLFKGNIDDKFKIGISFTKKSLKLYSDFYSSDLIIASPLGLRLVVGAEGDANRDFDFLASVEILILDQTELFLMQNWDHLLLLFDHLHIQPKESHGTDFSRIRSWVLNGWSKFYRQTIVFSSIIFPELNAIFNRRCCNYSGKVRVLNPVECGTISLVFVQMSHVFQKFKAESALNACDARFKFFIEKILPQYKDPSLNGILIYVPSYFDYVKIRNYLKREDYSFVQICEYSKDPRIARARDKFFHNETRFLLYSERFHFFRRIKLKGIRHIIFYQLPTFPDFYTELCNLIKVNIRVVGFLVLAKVQKIRNRLAMNDLTAFSQIETFAYVNELLILINIVNNALMIPLISAYLLLTDSKGQFCDWNPSAITVYCKYDVHQMSAIVKTSRASKLLSSEKDVHMFTTG